MISRALRLKHHRMMIFLKKNQIPLANNHQENNNPQCATTSIAERRVQSSAVTHCHARHDDGGAGGKCTPKMSFGGFPSLSAMIFPDTDVMSHKSTVKGKWNLQQNCQQPFQQLKNEQMNA